MDTYIMQGFTDTINKYARCAQSKAKPKAMRAAWGAKANKKLKKELKIDHAIRNKQAYAIPAAIGAGVGALGGAFMTTKGEAGRRWKNIAGGAVLGAGAGAGIRAVKGKNIKKYTGAGKVNSTARDTTNTASIVNKNTQTMNRNNKSVERTMKDFSANAKKTDADLSKLEAMQKAKVDAGQGTDPLKEYKNWASSSKGQVTIKRERAKADNYRDYMKRRDWHRGARGDSGYRRRPYGSLRPARAK